MTNLLGLVEVSRRQPLPRSTRFRLREAFLQSPFGQHPRNDAQVVGTSILPHVQFAVLPASEPAGTTNFPDTCLPGFKSGLGPVRYTITVRIRILPGSFPFVGNGSHPQLLRGLPLLHVYPRAQSSSRSGLTPQFRTAFRLSSFEASHPRRRHTGLESGRHHGLLIILFSSRLSSEYKF